MIRDIDKVCNLNGTALRYRKKETMEGLYFKEMLSKMGKLKNKEDKEKPPKKEKSNEDDIAHDLKKDHKEEQIEKQKEEQMVKHEGEGNFIDRFC